MAGDRRARRQRRHGRERRNIAGEPSDTVAVRRRTTSRRRRWSRSESASSSTCVGRSPRCAQVVGAMDRVVEVVLEPRQRRGRSSAGRSAGSRRCSTSSATSPPRPRWPARRPTPRSPAPRRPTGSDPGMLFAVAVAKSCVGHAASVVVRGAHQVLGAIGTTLEHELHTLTKPILARRSEFGSRPRVGRDPDGLAVGRPRPPLAAHHHGPRQAPSRWPTCSMRRCRHSSADARESEPSTRSSP